MQFIQSAHPASNSLTKSNNFKFWQWRKVCNLRWYFCNRLQYCHSIYTELTVDIVVHAKYSPGQADICTRPCTNVPACDQGSTDFILHQTIDQRLLSVMCHAPIHYTLNITHIQCRPRDVQKMLLFSRKSYSRDGIVHLFICLSIHLFVTLSQKHFSSIMNQLFSKCYRSSFSFATSKRHALVLFKSHSKANPGVLFIFSWIVCWYLIL